MMGWQADLHKLAMRKAPQIDRIGDALERIADVLEANAARDEGTGTLSARARHVRDICETSIRHDLPNETGPNHWTDRHWLAQSVLNILDGKADKT